MPNYGKTVVGGTSTVVNNTRGHPLPASTLASDETLLKSISMYCGAHHSDQIRLAVYQGGTVNDPDGADLIFEGITTGTAINQFITVTAAEETLDPTKVIWVCWKGTGTGGGSHWDVVYDTGTNKGDFHPDTNEGRYQSAVIASNEDTAWPDPWPADSGSQTNAWYSGYITVESATPVIIKSIPSITLTPTDTSVVATGTQFHATQGTSKLQLSDNATYGAGTLVDQTINTWAAESIDYDVVLGALAEGDLFLFVVHDPGGGGEDPSNAFPVNVQTPNDKIIGKQFQTPAGTGNQDIACGFEPTGAVIFFTSNTSQDTIQTDMHTGVFFWEPNGQVTLSQGHDAGGNDAARQQEEGVLNIRQGGSETDVATAVVSASGNNLRLNWSLAAAGYTMNAIVFGGTYVCHQDTTLVSGSPYTGTQFKAKLLFAASVGMAAMPGSSDAGLWTWGFTTQAADQFKLHCFTGGGLGTERNTGVRSTGYVSQVQSETETWVADLVTIDDEGHTWDNSNTDSYSFLAVHARGAGIHVGTFTKDSSGSDDATQQIGDQGFFPGLILFHNAHRTTETIADGDSCAAMGFSDREGALEVSTIATTNPTDNSDEAVHTTGCIRGSDIDAVSDAVGTISIWADNPTIKWTTNDTVAALISYVAFEGAAFDQTLIQDEVPFLGIVPSPALVVGAVSITAVDNDDFLGIVPSPELVATAEITTADNDDFLGIVPGHGVTPGTASITDHDNNDFLGLIPNHALVAGAVSITAVDNDDFLGIVPSQTVLSGMTIIGQEDEVTFYGIVPAGTTSIIDLINTYDVPFRGLIPKHRLVKSGVSVVQNVVPFLGIVPAPVIPQAGAITISATAPLFMGLIPNHALTAGSLTLVQQQTPFLGIVPGPSLLYTLGQAEVPFLGLVPSPTVVIGTGTNVVQNVVPFLGLVPSPTVVVGAGPNVVQNVVPFLGIVPAGVMNSLFSINTATDLAFLGIVPDPTLVAGAAPAIVQQETPFLGIVPSGGSISMVLTQGVVPFMGIIPNHVGILRDGVGQRVQVMDSL